MTKERTAKEQIDWVNIFGALADKHRLRLLVLFASYGDGLCVCELVDALLLPQYKISRHLAVLRKSGLVRTEKRGLWVYYGLNSTAEVIREVLRIISSDGPYPIMIEDARRLEKRLALREGGMCIIGFSSAEQRPRS
jgi:ArsR family transcriptional regulator